MTCSLVSWCLPSIPLLSFLVTAAFSRLTTASTLGLLAADSHYIAYDHQLSTSTMKMALTSKNSALSNTTVTAVTVTPWHVRWFHAYFVSGTLGGADGSEGGTFSWTSFIQRCGLILLVTSVNYWLPRRQWANTTGRLYGTHKLLLVYKTECLHTGPYHSVSSPLRPSHYWNQIRKLYMLP